MCDAAYCAVAPGVTVTAMTARHVAIVNVAILMAGAAAVRDYMLDVMCRTC